MFSRKKTSNVAPSTSLVPFEWVKRGIVKIRGENTFFIVFKVKEAPNLFLKDDDEQFAFFLGLKEHFAALNPGDQMQILVVARVLHVLPYVQKLQRIADKSKGRKKQIALSNIEFFLNMLQNRELIGRSIYITVNIPIPTRLPQGADVVAIIEEIVPKKVKELSEFTAQYGVKVERLSTQEIIEYLYKEFNPSIARIPEMKVPKEVVFLTTLDEKTYEQMKQAEAKKAEEKEKEKIIPPPPPPEPEKKKEPEKEPIFVDKGDNEDVKIY